MSREPRGQRPGGRRGLAAGQARLPRLRRAGDPHVVLVLGPRRRHVGPRRHALHHARRQVRTPGGQG